MNRRQAPSARSRQFAREVLRLSFAQAVAQVRAKRIQARVDRLIWEHVHGGPARCSLCGGTVDEPAVQQDGSVDAITADYRCPTAAPERPQ